jgi:hypothetical protein
VSDADRDRCCHGPEGSGKCSAVRCGQNGKPLARRLRGI